MPEQGIPKREPGKSTKKNRPDPRFSTKFSPVPPWLIALDEDSALANVRYWLISDQVVRNVRSCQLQALVMI